MIFCRKATILYEGKLWSRSDLAEHLGLSASVLNGRIARGWPPERWGEPVQIEMRNHKEPQPMTPLDMANHKSYTDEELWETYQFFRGQSNELTVLADFMCSDATAASEQIVKWKREGRI